MPGSYLGNTQGAFIATVALTPASVAANTSVEQTFAVPGLRVGDYVDATGVTQNGMSIGQTRVTADNTLGIRFINNTAGALVPTAGVYQVLVIRPSGGTPATVTL